MGAPKKKLSTAFAEVIKAHRGRLGISMAGLAAKAGLHQTYIGLIERGTRNPSIDAMQAIAEALGVSPSKLIREAERLLEE